MFTKLTALSLKHRLITVFLYAAICFFGFKTLQTLTIDVFPDLTRPTVTLIVEAPGFSAEVLEKQVIIPVESVLGGASGVSRITSTSSSGFGLVKAEFDFNADIYRARQIVNERLLEVSGQFPPFVSFKMGPVSSIMGEIMLIGLTAQDSHISGMDLRDLAVYGIQKRLLTIPGVASVSVTGGDIREYQIRMDPFKMKVFGISVAEVRAAAENSSAFVSGAFLSDGTTESLFRIGGWVGDIEDLENTPIDTPYTGFPITLGRIGTVKIAPQSMKRGDAAVNGISGVLLSVQKQPGVDTLRLTQRIEDELKTIQENLPSGVNIHGDLFKQSDFIRLAADNIRDALIVSSFLIALVLFAFLAHVRMTLVVMTAIPVTFFMTVLVFSLFGFSINTMTLGGLAMALGTLIDDAIVMAENVFKRLRQRKKGGDLFKPVLEAAREMMSSVILSTVLVFLSFLPLFALSGTSGKIFAPLALSFMVAMVCSTVVAMTLTPVLSSYAAQKTVDRENAFILFLKRIHLSAMAFCFRNFRKMVALMSVVFLFCVIGLFSFGRTFLPPFNEGGFNVSVALAPSTSLDETNAVMEIATKRMIRIPEIQTVARRTGRSEFDEHALPLSVSEFEITLRPDKTRPLAEIALDLRRALDLPGMVSNISQPMTHRIDFILSGSKSQIALKLFGPDLHFLKQKADAVAKLMSTLDGFTDVQTDPVLLVPEMQIELDRHQARRLGLQAGVFAKDMETFLSGDIVARVLQGDRSYNVVLMADARFRDSPDMIRQLPIRTMDGKFLPASAVSKIHRTKAPNEIFRENGLRRLVIGANLDGRDLVSAVKELKQHIHEDISLPEGYFYAIDGQFEEQAKASFDLILYGMLSLGLIVIVLYLHFKKASLTFQILLSLPFALMGGVFGVFFSGGILSLPSLIGFITLAGISVRNGLLLFSVYLKNEAHTVKEQTARNLMALTTERLVPILMTMLTSVVGFVPLIAYGHLPGKEMLYPAACVIAFGLLTTTLYALVLMPAVYARLMKIK